MEGVNADNHQVLFLTAGEVDKRIKEALYSNDVGCPETVLYELSQATYHDIFMKRISKAVWRCLNSSATRCRRIQKALTLLTYLVINGADACTIDVINHLDDITTLHNLVLPAPNGELEYIIKEKAINLVNLVCDPELLAKKRREFAALRSRFVAVSSNNGHVETQVLHKPIYAVETRPGIPFSIAASGSKMWNFLTKRGDDKGKPPKKFSIFNLLKKDPESTNNTAMRVPVLRTVDGRTTVEYRNQPIYARADRYDKTIGDTGYLFRPTYHVSSGSSYDTRSISDDQSESSLESESDVPKRREVYHRSVVDSLSRSTSRSHSASDYETSWEEYNERRGLYPAKKELARRSTHAMTESHRNELSPIKQNIYPHIDRDVPHGRRSSRHLGEDAYTYNYYAEEDIPSIADEPSRLSLHVVRTSNEPHLKSHHDFKNHGIAGFHDGVPGARRATNPFGHMTRY
ncbi:Clathrin interactor EPSIN 1 [Babesia sp. Xinjiang]|uniref:Clathrin interactor EPSIN 1 n=1 Tax=Babesia sp. Xinjiang TaxID=462227 RepID=UPI000A24C7F1|nr:Clathrin interactor EPSIN 1 [Babesia sp. Xinjiang]ORM40348.1 Clathrin interactor EPSIN 1 [Babesia sp. Xinjiang]